MFAACLPQPVHQLPGGAVATAIRDALVSSSFRAHVHQPAPKRPAPVVAELAHVDAPDPELVAVLRSLVLEVLDCDGLPFAGLLSVHYPACAGGRPCVEAGELARYARFDLPPGELVVTLLTWARLPLTAAWRRVSYDVAVKVDGGIWLTLEELGSAARFVRGRPGVLLRRALAKWEGTAGELVA